MRLALVLALVAAPALARPVAIPVATKTVTFELPEGWVQSFEQATDKAFIRGYVPPAGSGEGNQMITLTVTRNLAGIPTLSLLDFAQFGLGALQAQCAGDSKFEVVSEDYTIADRPALGLFLSCANTTGTDTGRHEETLFIAFRGPTDFYALQWIERTEPTEAASAYDADHWGMRARVLSGTARICDLAEGQTAPPPCP